MAAHPTNAELREFARSLAAQAGALASTYVGRVTVSHKDDESPVTAADHAVQAFILDAIATQYPDHAVICEEGIQWPQRHAPADSARYCWVIDPIDGTRNFARGIPVYAVSVAVLDCGTPAAGAMYDASVGNVYSAGLGGGADCDGDALLMSRDTLGADTTLLLSSFHDRSIPPLVRRWMGAYLFRNYGSLCLHLAWLAAGRADGAYARDCRLWDIAAGALLISESGGRITRDDGSALWPFDTAAYSGGILPILAGTATMHDTLIASLRAGETAD